MAENTVIEYSVAWARENGKIFLASNHPRPQAQARAALTVALGQAVEQLIVIGSFALKECCGWEGNAG